MRAIPEPLGLYRVHGDNYFASRSPEEKRERHLEKFIHNCDALEAHLRAMGVDRSPDFWKLWKGIYDPVAEAAAQERLAATLPADASFILVDENAWRTGAGNLFTATRRAIPFLERNGEYWGPPASDDAAIHELERLREEGADFIVFTWFTFWWLDYYAGFASHLWTSYHCPVWEGFFGIFDLRWPQRFASLRDDIAAAVPAGGTYVLMDERDSPTDFDRNPELVNERHATAFFDTRSDNGGAPADDRSAVAQVKRLHAGGAQFIVFPWFAFEWLDSYRDFAEYLRKSFPCVVDNDRLVVFRLTA